MRVNVLGADPGFANFGYGIVNVRAADLRREGVLDAGVITTAKSDKKQSVFAADDNVRRADEICAALLELMSMHDVRAICAEAMSFPRSASVAAKMAMSWGVIVALARVTDVPILVATPKELKLKVAGFATASKEDVEAAVKEHYGSAWVSNMKKGDREHVFDAVAAVLAVRDSHVLRALR